MGYEECLICLESKPVKAPEATHGYNDHSGCANLYCETHWEWLEYQQLCNNGWWKYYYDLYSKWR